MNPIRKVIIRFHSGPSISFLGTIHSLKFEGEKVTSMEWENAEAGTASSLTSERLRFVNIAKIRDVVEVAVSNNDARLDGERFSVSTASVSAPKG